MMIKNSLIYFILIVLHFTAQTEVKIPQPDVLIPVKEATSNNTESMMVETTDGELIHLMMTPENKKEIQKQKSNLYTQDVKEIYKLTNLTPYSVLVKYTNDSPFLHKGSELKKSKCMYIHRNYFDYLSLLWNSELLCSSHEYRSTNKITLCQPMDYTLRLISQQQTFMGMPSEVQISSLRGWYKFSYLKNLEEMPYVYTPNIDFEKPPYLILLNQDKYEEECKIF